MPNPQPSPQSAAQPDAKRLAMGALHTFESAPTIQQLKAKAFDLQQEYGPAVAAQFLELGTQLSPAVTEQERLPYKKLQDEQGFNVTDPVAYERNRSSGTGETYDQIVDRTYGPEDDVSPDLAASNDATNMQAEEDRALARARAATTGGSGRTAPAKRPAMQPVAPGAKQTGAQAPAAPPSHAESGMINLIGDKKPRRGVTTVEEPRGHPKNASSGGDSEETLLDKAKKVLDKVRTMTGNTTDEEQEAINREKENEFRNPSDRNRTVSL